MYCVCLLKKAIINGDLEGVRLLLDQGEDINERDLGGRTPLLVAAVTGDIDIVNVLIAADADVNIASANGITPLMEAAGEGHLNIVNTLIDKGANINAQDNFGKTALMYVAVNGGLYTAKTLIAAGADVDAKDKYGVTALDIAKAHKHPEIVEAIKQAKQNKQYSNMNAIYTPNSTANSSQRMGRKLNTVPDNMELINAIRSNSGLETIQGLLDAGANVNVQDSKGNTALIYAVFQGNIDIVQELITRGINVNAQERGGNTALMFVAMNGNVEIAKALLAGGAVIDIQNNIGATALDYAKIYEHTEIEQLIQEAQQGVSFERIIKEYEKEKMKVPMMMKKYQHTR